MTDITYLTSLKLGAKIVDMLTRELGEDEFFANGLAALDVARSIMMQVPPFVGKMGNE